MNQDGMTLNKKAWYRYMARSIDITIGALFISLIFGILIAIVMLITNNFMELSVDFLSTIPEFILGTVSVALYLIIEASMFSSFKTTLGKKIFGITLTDTHNEPLTFNVALKRNFLLFFKGLALALPLLSMLTMIISYQNYTDKGVTSWDEDCETLVHFKPISELRAVGAILFFIVIVVLKVYLVRGV